MEGEVDPVLIEGIHVPMVPALGRELVQELGVEPVDVLPQAFLRDEGERIALPLGRNADERGPGMRVAPVIARRVRAREILRRHERGVPALEQEILEGATQLRVALSRGDEAGLQGIEQPVDEHDAIPGPRQGVGGLVISRHVGIEAPTGEAGVLVRAVHVVGIGSQIGDGL